VPDAPTITVADDAPPLAHMLGAQLGAKLEDPKQAATAARLRGALAMRHTGPDDIAATVRFKGDRIEIVGGVDADARVVVAADLLMMGQPGAPRPRVKGVLRAPRFALRAGKLLRPPRAG